MRGSLSANSYAHPCGGDLYGHAAIKATGQSAEIKKHNPVGVFDFYLQLKSCQMRTIGEK